MSIEPPRWSKIAFLTPKTGLSPRAFERHWRATHGRVVANAPDYARWRSRYAQNHVLEAGSGAPFVWAGIAQFELPGANEEGFSSSLAYVEYIAPDEARFIDLERTISMTARIRRIRPGRTPHKLVVVRGPGSVMSATAQEAAVGWTTHEVIAESTRLPGGRPAGSLEIQHVDELWFDHRDDALSAGALGEHSSVLVEEVVFFNEGRPTALAMPPGNHPRPAP